MKNLEKLLKHSKNLKVLFVEDSATIRKATQKILLKYFDHVDTAEDGKEALDQYVEFYTTQNTYYDLVITDIEMPIMSGKELSKHLLEFNYKQEIIVISSINDFNILMDLLNIGIKKFISKPIDEEQFLDVIKKVLISIQETKQFEQDKLEILKHNEVLQQQQEEHLEIIESRVKELEGFAEALRTPLDSISKFSSLLKQRLKDDEKSFMMIDTILQVEKDLEELVESIVDSKK